MIQLTDTYSLLTNAEHGQGGLLNNERAAFVSGWGRAPISKTKAKEIVLHILNYLREGYTADSSFKSYPHTNEFRIGCDFQISVTTYGPWKAIGRKGFIEIVRWLNRRVINED